MPMMLTRRCILESAVPAAAVFIRAPQLLAAAGDLEPTSVRIVNDGSGCIAPLFAAEELLQAEGFTNVRLSRPSPLAPVYGWFTEGFDTADLKEAKALLDQLA